VQDPPSHKSESRNEGARLHPMIAARKHLEELTDGDENQQLLQNEDPLSQTTTDEPTALEALNAHNPFGSKNNRSYDQQQLLEKVQYKLHTI
jgi:hypothetical protein